MLADIDQTEYSEADGYANNTVEAQEEVVSHHSLTVTLNTLTATILNTETSWTGLEKNNKEFMQKAQMILNSITYSTFTVAVLPVCQVELSLTTTVAARASFWKL